MSEKRLSLPSFYSSRKQCIRKTIGGEEYAPPFAPPFQIIFEFDEIPVRRVIIRRFAEQCYGLFVKSKVKPHKFSFKNEAVWMLLFSGLPLVIGVLLTLILFLAGYID